MIAKDSTTIVNFYVTDTDGLPATGQASNISASISIDGGNATSISATISEKDSINLPGWYEFEYTFNTAGNAFITFSCTGCIIMPWEEQVVEVTGSSASDIATAVWSDTSNYPIFQGQYPKGYYQANPPIVNVWSQQAYPQQSTTYGDLVKGIPTINTNVTAVKAKTDNLPANPAATGDAMTLTSAYDAAKTASQLTSADLSGLSTFDPTTDTVFINATQAATMTTATGFATSSDVSGAVSALETYGDNHWTGSSSGGATAQQIWEYPTRTITASPTDVSGLATSSALSAVASDISAVKAKTDNLPESPAAVGSAMTLTEATVTAIKSGLATGDNIEAALGALEMYGDVNWPTADLSGLATQTDITDAVTALETYGDGKWLTADVSELATSSELATAETNIVSAMPDISGLPTAADVWEFPTRELTSEISVEISDENIADITESVWEAPDRTLTDMKPKPNQKSIVCTPSNVINSYGIPRLENWTNETAGTQAFDDKINTYITLAKEKMATDLNDQINSAIAYIGADNITELCAWLTGYNLYQDDESTDTDSLPETRYNQYLEQIHRIMENI